MKNLKLIVVSLLIGFGQSAMAQTDTDTTVIENTTIIKSTTTTTDQPAVQPAPQPAPAPVVQETTSEDQVGTHIGFRFMPFFSKLRANSTDVGNAAVITTELTLGYGFGGFIGYYFNNHIGLHLEVMYTSITQEIAEKEDDVRQVDLSYLNFPLLLTLNTDLGKPINFNLHFGPQMGILLGSKARGYTTDDAAGTTIVVGAKPYDLGIAYGAGIDFGFGEGYRTHLNIGFRGVNGLVNIDDESKTTDNHYIIARSKSSAYGGYIGIMFKL